MQAIRNRLEDAHMRSGLSRLIAILGVLALASATGCGDESASADATVTRNAIEPKGTSSDSALPTRMATGCPGGWAMPNPWAAATISPASSQ